MERERVAEVDAYPQPFVRRAELIDGGRLRVRSNGVLYCTFADIIEILGHPGNAARIQRHSDSARAAEVAPPGRKRARNSNRFASQQLWFARFVWPHSANSSCP